MEQPHDKRPTGLAIWDLPTRLFHGCLVILFICLWITSGISLEWHMRAGEAMLTLVLFRLAWGIIGSHTARFRSFVAGPGAGLRHAAELIAAIRHRPARPHRSMPGHTALGGWMILVLLILLAVQTGTGLFATDDILTDGPLNHLVSEDTAKLLTRIHKFNFNLILAAIGVHVAAALFYLLWMKDDLIRPMITGRNPDMPANGAAPLRFAPAWLAALALAGAILLVWGITAL